MERGIIFLLFNGFLLLQLVHTFPPEPNTPNVPLRKVMESSLNQEIPFKNETVRAIFTKARVEDFNKWFNSTIHVSADIFKSVLREANTINPKGAELQAHIVNITRFVDGVESLDQLPDSPDKNETIFTIFQQLTILYKRYDSGNVQNPTADTSVVIKLLEQHHWASFKRYFEAYSEAAGSNYKRDLNVYIASLSESEREWEHELITWYNNKVTDHTVNEKARHFPQFSDFLNKDEKNSTSKGV